MPVNVEWDNETHTIIRYDVQDPWELEEYSQALDETWTLIDAECHPVHVVVDLSDAFSFPKHLFSIAVRTNTQIHPRQNFVIGVKVSPYLQTMVRVTARFYPRLGHNLLFAHTLHEAYNIIQTYEVISALKD